MKKTLITTAFLFFGFLIAAAQEPVWTKSYEQIYGSRAEYIRQTELRDMMGYDFYRLIGFKSFYTNGLSGFLQQTRDFKMDATESKHCLTYTLTGRKQSRFYLKFWLNPDDRVTKARFTGNPDDLAFLFVNYWPSNTDWTEPQQLRRGVIAIKEVLGEQIVYNYTGGKPFIEVKSLSAM